MNMVHGLGLYAGAAAGGVTFFMCIKIIAEEWGIFAGVLGFLLAPVTCVVMPWYAGFALGNWIPLIICGGGLISVIALLCLGEFFENLGERESILGRRWRLRRHKASRGVKKKRGHYDVRSKSL